MIGNCDSSLLCKEDVSCELLSWQGHGADASGIRIGYCVVELLWS